MEYNEQEKQGEGPSKRGADNRKLTFQSENTQTDIEWVSLYWENETAGLLNGVAYGYFIFLCL